MRVICVSNDSEMFIFPELTGSRGIRPRDHGPYVKALEGLRSDIPGCIGNDDRDISLDEYRMPIGKTLGGRFTEVRRLNESIVGSRLAIVSGRHGLIDSETRVLPYSCAVESKREAANLDDRTGFVESLMEIHQISDMVLVFLPRAHTEVLIERWHGEMEDMLFVTSHSLFPELFRRGATVLSRRGARVGRHNIGPIMEEIKRRDGADAGI